MNIRLQKKMRHSVAPTSQKVSYDLNSQVELRFILRGYIEGHTIRVNGDIAITGVNLLTTNSVYGTACWIPTQPGIHSMIGGLVVERNGMQIETENNYAQMAAAALAAANTSRDVVSTAASIMELRSGGISTMGPCITALASGAPPLEVNHLSFSVQPICGLTRMGLIDGDKNNYVLVLRLNLPNAFLVNTFAGVTPVVTLSNVYCSYSTWSPEAALKVLALPAIKDQPMLTIVTLSASLTSLQETVSLNVNMPGPVLGWFANFAPSAALSSVAIDNYACYQPNQLQRVRFLLNGSDFEQRFPYQLAPITSDPLLLYEKASSAVALLRCGVVGSDDTPDGSYGARERESSGAAFIIGQKYEPAIDMRGSNILGVEVVSGGGGLYPISGATPWQMYISFIVSLGSERP